MKKCLPVFLLLIFNYGFTQAPVQWHSGEIGLRLKKLGVLGSVLYVAAHPDDENTRLLAYLSREKLYRTGYLSLTRGDGGQNLIGDEQGIELGLIRTQELLAARRIDGAEQFFSRAYDFGFSKSTEEAIETWGHDKVLSDVVWVIRKFRPDVIVTRFPGDSRAGHGHHSASSVLAREAFRAAADPARFPEQFRYGVTPWQAKRILWNTFNFGGNNTISENQFKIDVGAYQPLLGRSFGEIAAESRSQHKSQGFGVPSSRGEGFEYFSLLEGTAPENELLDGVNVNWARIEKGEKAGKMIEEIRAAYSYENPEKSLPALVSLYKEILLLPDSWWKSVKLEEVKQLIQMTAGLYLEASSPSEYAVQGDSVRFNLNAISRSSDNIKIRSIRIDSFDTLLNTTLQKNKNMIFARTLFVSPTRAITQPYWLTDEMDRGSFTVNDQQLIGRPDNPPAYTAVFDVTIEGQDFTFTIPAFYKHTDPVKGELFQPLVVIPPVSVNTSPGVLLFRKNQKDIKPFAVTAAAYANVAGAGASVQYRFGNTTSSHKDSSLILARNNTKTISIPISAANMNGLEKDRLLASVEYTNHSAAQTNYLALARIDYDHIPSIRYFYPDGVTVLNVDLATAGKRIGYIRGAGDRVPEALEQMGYNVVFITENDLNTGLLRQFDAVITGVRAYNVNSWLDKYNEVLLQYIREGGNVVVQYNTNSFFGPFIAKMGPYPFNISRNRVTDENSEVRFTDPSHKILNWPNRISKKDFEGWIQERGIYFAEKAGDGFRSVLAMKDPGEKEDQTGSLIVADYGKGRFIYTGLAFFRQLPSGVPGAYRLFANLVSNPNLKLNATK